MPSRALQIWTYMALRFILRHRRKTIATASFIILGTGILVFLHALTVGINDTMVLNTTRLHYGDAFLEIPAAFDHPGAIAQNISAEKGVESALFRYRLSGLLTNNTVSAPAVLYAVNPEMEAPETAIALRIASGKYPRSHCNEILLGQTIAERLKATAGDTISVLESSGKYLGDFKVSGSYQTEIPHFDNMVAYVPIQVIDPAILRSNPSEIAIFLDKHKNYQKIKARLETLIPQSLSVQTWDELMPDLLQLIEMNEVAMRILILFIFILVGFGISNSFVLTIVERFREFGILKAMGVTPKELVGLVFLESFMVCLAATLIGLFMGWLLTLMVAHWGIDFSSLTSHNRYFIVTGLVRPRATLESIYWPGILAVMASIVSSYLPTRIAAQKTTSETLRFA
jgi:ABC-type lipoprotein release transport system permease subunit